MKTIVPRPMNRQEFEKFGDVIDFDRPPDFAINKGMCDRYHGLSNSEATGEDAGIIISLGRAKPRSLPLNLEMMERHPLGSQAFIPLGKKTMLVVVAEDRNGTPAEPIAFLTMAGQGVNYRRNTWHAVLSPLDGTTDFVIVDREGPGDNLEEYFFKVPYLITDAG